MSGALPSREFLLVPAHTAELAPGSTVARALPRRARRTVGAWCFADHFGPEPIAGTPGMRVGPHPHIGLQTVSWLVDGEILHRDSLGSEQLIRPGELNLMTAGRGIVHSEESPAGSTRDLHGAQLWVALPDAARTMTPTFDHHADLPVVDIGDVRVTVMIGELLGAGSPARAYSPLVGCQLATAAAARLELPLEPTFEHALLVLAGAMKVEDEVVERDVLVSLGGSREEIILDLGSDARVLFLGGAPLGEEILMWWNFVARDRAEMETARAQYLAGEFGAVHGFDGPPMPTPEPYGAASPTGP